MWANSRKYKLSHSPGEVNGAVETKRVPGLTGAVGGLTLQRHDLMLLLIRLHRQVGQVLLHLAGHLGVFVQLLGVEQRAAADALLVATPLHVHHVGVGAALTQRPDHVTTEAEERGRGMVVT